MVTSMVVGYACLLAALPVNGRSVASCNWFPSDDFIDVAMECSGHRVKHPPVSPSASLQHLRLTGTSIRRLDTTTFEGRLLPELKSLYVTRGELTTIDKHALCPLTALVQLDLSKNMLKELDPESFACNQHLRSLGLSDNPDLEELPALASSSIEKLYMENCNLVKAEPSALAGMTALRELHLNGNPRLDCPSVINQFSESFPSLIVNCRSRSNNLSPPYADNEKLVPQSSSPRSLMDANVPQPSSNATHTSNAVLLIISVLLLYFVFT